MKDFLTKVSHSIIPSHVPCRTFLECLPAMGITADIVKNIDHQSFDSLKQEIIPKGVKEQMHS